jgi:hypothetical protein
MTDDKRSISAEMRFMRRTAGYALPDHNINEAIMREVQTSQITGFIEQQRRNWKRNILVWRALIGF